MPQKRRINTTAGFIKRARARHGIKYDYSLSNYVAYNKPVKIVCPIHGEFLQKPFVHYVSNCPKCGRRYSTEEFIKRSKEVHKQAYDYSKVIYKGVFVPVTLICKKHDKAFQITPDNHIFSKQGCPLCGSGKHRTNGDFIQLAKEVHGDLYDYSLVEYKSATKKVDIICKVHGIFKQQPDCHLNRSNGCPSCKVRSKGEECIVEELSKLIPGEEVLRQYSDQNCRYKLPLRFDFFLPKRNLAIEYDGEQHFRAVDFSNKASEQRIVEIFEAIQERDKAKQIFCDTHGITLLRIPHYKRADIPVILKIALNILD
jgi:hypothetical protein